ncbi:hypothetical protein [Streptomyces sp. NPDC060205]|uniref:hypothetical protein n=1 Tax=Streptomyces sp. NPDC060205 TaxID=3347072 RepID=UPI003647FF7F
MRQFDDTCTLPLTGRACVHRVITDPGVFASTAAGLSTVERAPAVTAAQVAARTGAPVRG